LATSWKPGLATSFQLVRLVGCGLNISQWHLTDLHFSHLLTYLFSRSRPSSTKIWYRTAVPRISGFAVQLRLCSSSSYGEPIRHGP